MKEIFDRLHGAKRANQLSADMDGRSPFFQLGRVTNNEDPEGKRRVKVTLQSKAGKTESNWLFRLVASPSDDPPIPRVGQTVGVMFIEGDPHQGVYFGSVTNLPNPERNQTEPVKDDGRRIEGERRVEVDKDDTLHVEGTLTITNGAGCSITLTTDGQIQLHAPAGVKITQESPDGVTTIGGTPVAVIGALDDAGHALVTSGQ